MRDTRPMRIRHQHVDTSVVFVCCVLLCVNLECLFVCVDFGISRYPPLCNLSVLSFHKATTSVVCATIVIS